MSEQTPVQTIAAALGEPDTCPVCGADWRKGSCHACRHMPMFAEALPVGDQMRLYRKLLGRDRKDP